MILLHSRMSPNEQKNILIVLIIKTRNTLLIFRKIDSHNWLTNKINKITFTIIPVINLYLCLKIALTLEMQLRSKIKNLWGYPIVRAKIQIEGFSR